MIRSGTFLGKYTNYRIEFDKGMTADERLTNEFSQDSVHSGRLFEANDRVSLVPNAEKINIFTSDGEWTLIKGVKKRGVKKYE